MTATKEQRGINEICDAAERGATIECKGYHTGGIWKEWTFGKVAMGRNIHHHEWRIKPKAKRLIRGDELPVSLWIRRGSSEWFPTVRIGSTLIDITGTNHFRDIENINDSCVTYWSPDRHEVKSFWVEE